MTSPPPPGLAPAPPGLAPGRSCGTCTVCCRVLEIAALDKPAGLLCGHCTGAACGIYPARPDACARWHCLWRRVGGMPDSLRPDRSGVMFSIEGQAPNAGAREGACIVGRAVGGAHAFRGWQARAAFAMFVREGSLPVWKASARRATLLHPGRRGLAP